MQIILSEREYEELDNYKYKLSKLKDEIRECFNFMRKVEYDNEMFINYRLSDIENVDINICKITELADLSIEEERFIKDSLHIKRYSYSLCNHMKKRVNKENIDIETLEVLNLLEGIIHKEELMRLQEEINKKEEVIKLTMQDIKELASFFQLSEDDILIRIQTEDGRKSLGLFSNASLHKDED